MLKNIFKTKVLWLGFLLLGLLFGVNYSLAASSLASRLQGYILLQVESLGEAWYVIPKEEKMVYMKDGAVAYQIMREVSLGITNANLAKIPVGIEARFNDVDTDSDGLSDKLEEGLETDPNKADTDNDGFKDGEEIKNNYSPLGPNKLVYDQNLVNRLKGYILLQVEKQGQAWYVNPKDGKRYYMQDGPAAYNIMRYLSLGITNANLNLIPKSSRVFNVDTSGNSSNQGNQNNQGNNNNSTSTPPGNNQGGNSGGGGGGGGSSTPPPSADTQNPSTPSNLSASASGTQISLSWTASTDNVGVVGYQILRSTTNGSGYTQIATSNTTSYTNTNLNIGTTYYYVVKAYDAAGNVSSNSSQTQAVAVDNQSPTVPSALTANATGVQIALSWTASTDNVGVTQYIIERSNSAIAGFATVATSTTSVYTNTRLSVNVTYYYRVKAQDLAGNNSGYSEVVSATTNNELVITDTQKPSAPTNLSASASGTTISLSWTASTDNVGVVGYQILRSTTNGSGYTQIATSNTTSYSNTNLNIGTTYYYLVRAYDAAGNVSLDSLQVQATVPIPADTQAPTAPTSLVATPANREVALSWSASTDNTAVTGYQVLRSTTNGSGYVQQTTVNTTVYVDTNLTNGTTYYYVIKAYDAAGLVSNNSNQAQATPADSQAPSSPTNLTATVSGTQSTLSWSASTDNVGVTGYQVLRSTTNGSGYTQVTTLNTTSYTNTGLTNGTTYYYVIRAYDAAGNYSGNSNQATATVGSVTPPSGSVSITGVSGTMSAGQTVTISGSGFGVKNRQQPLMFDDISSITGYQGYLQNNTIVPTRGCIENSTSCEANPQPTNQSLPWYNHWYGGTPRFYIGSSSRYTGHPAYRATNLADDFSTKGFFARDFAVNTSEGWTNLDWWIRSNLPFGEGPGGIVSGKILRLWHNPNIVDQVVVVNMPNPVFIVDQGCTVHTNPAIEYFASYPLNQWSHLNILTRVSSSGTEAKFLVNGELVATVTGFCGNDGIYDYLRMVGLDPSFPEYLDPSLEFLWGDIYFDDSLARVVISDSSTFNPFGGSSTNHYEVQNIQSWSSNSVSLKFNPGSFTSGQTAYLYVVDSNGNVNTSGYPVVISGTATPDTQSPTTPSNLSASASGTSISLSWTASSDNVGVSQYLIERSTSASSGFTQIATSNTTSYTNSGLSNSTTYYYRVRAQDAAGLTSSYSSNASATTAAPTQDTQAPTTPSNLSASASGTTISLSWTASTDNVGVSQYLIERSTSASSGFTQIATSNTTSYTNSGLSNSTTYYYRVRAQDAAGLTSGYSSNASATTGAVTVNSTNLIQNSWDFSSTAWDGDTLGANPWSPKANFVFTSAQSDPFGTNKAFRVALGTSGRPYQQRDSTPNLTLNYDNVVVSLYVKYGNTPNLIFGLNNTTTNTEYEQTFNFSNGVPVFSSGTNDGTTVVDAGNGWYRISMRLALLSRGIKGHSFKGRVTPAGSSSTSGAYSYVTGFQLESGTTAGAYTETPSGVSDTQSPTTPSNLSASASGTTISLSWTASTDNVGVSQYLIERSTSASSGFTQIATSNTTSYTNSGLSNSTTYYYRVRAQDAAGLTSSYSSNASAITGAPTQDTQAPTTPSNLSASASGTTISLSWTASSDNVGVSQYLIERSTSASSGFTQIATSNTTSYTNSGLSNSTTYYYRVRAQDAAGLTSSYSSNASATTGAATPPPSGSVTVSGVSDTSITHNQSITISGSGFGSKSSVAPLNYDTMESSDFSTAWQSHNHLVIGSDSANRRHANSTYYGTHNFQGNLYQSAGFFTGSNSQVRDTWYGRYWFKLDNNWDWGTTGEPAGDGNLANVKIFRLFSPADINEDFVVATEGFSGGGIIYKDENTVDPLHYADTNISEWTKNTWHVFDFAFKEGTLGGTNGIFKMWFNGKLVANTQTLMTRQNFDLLKRPLILGFYNSWFDGNSDRDDFYIDDAYIDETWSRIMLCNQATWNDSVFRHCEIQAPQTIWNNSSIQFSANTGSFTSGQTAYLYVIDNNGNVNSSGYPIQIASVLGDSITSCNTQDQETINWTSLPENILVRGCGSSIYAISGGQRVYIPSLEVLRRDYPGQRIYNVSETLLSSYPIVYR